jgi:Spy/CpxP family protein refolding chaperone
MRKALIALVAVTSAAIVLGAAGAASRAAAGRPLDAPLGRFITGQIGRKMVLASELNLTTEQRDGIREIVLAHRAEIAAVARPVVEKRRALREAVMADDPSPRKIRRAAEDLGDAVADAAVLAAKIKGEIAEILSPEQLRLIKEHLADKDAAVDGFLERVAEAE